MNGFDLLIFMIIGFCLVRGFFKGLIREVSGIIGVIAAFYGGNLYYDRLLPHVRDWIETPGLQKLVCFVIVFMGILVVVHLAALVIRKLLQLVFLGWVDRLFGLVFGAAKGILIATVLFIIGTTFIPGGSVYLSHSMASPYLSKSSDTLIIFASKNMRVDFSKKLKGMEEKWKR